MNVGTQPGAVRFGDFTVDFRLKELRRNGMRLKLRGQPFAVLTMLLEHPGELVTREELRARLWQEETFVDFDHSLNVAINRLRETLCDSVERPRFIETIPRTGYRFIAPVNVAPIQVSVQVPAATEFAATPSPAEAAGVEQGTKFEPATVPSTKPGSRRLPWYAAALAFVLLCAAGVYLVGRARHPAAASPAPKVMLAVLPFENLTGDPSNEYFSDGLTEEMITQLAALQPDRLGVIARTSVMSYKHGDKSIGRVASQLGVEYIVEGSLRQSQGRVRITAQLIQVKDQTHVWAQDYDRDISDVLTMEREVSGSVAREIQLQLPPQQHADLVRPRATDPEAHELYLKGRFYWNKRTRDGFQKSTEYFNGAIEKDPNYAEAYAGLADSYRFLMNDLAPEEVIPKARAAAEKALVLNPNLAEAHGSLGLIAPYYDWDWEGARQHLERAIELSPNSAILHDWYAEGYLSSMGKLDESLAELRVAQRLDPLSLVILADIGKTLYFARRYDEAIAQLRAVVEMDPHYFPGVNWLWKSYLEKGMYGKTLEIIQLERGNGHEGTYIQDLAYLRARTGDRWESSRLLSKVFKMSEKGHMDPGGIAHVYLALGDKGLVFEWLEKAFAAHSNYISSLKVWPVYDPIRNDPRFIDLERRAKLLP
jgi:TolB-like protein/DNA-binding winged helix-turn-helix (wHTH) protein/tetratricopeptide (TPR) repeat protein